MSSKRLCLPVLLVLMSVFTSLKAQFTDNFSDGDFTNDPLWTSSNVSGTGDDFQVSSEELQSKGPSASATIWISTNQINSYASSNTVWEFKARYANAPSSSNKIRVYLVSDKADLSDSPQGYYIEMGETNSGDGIDFYKTSSSTPLIEDPSASVASGINVNVRVTRTTTGDWTLEADPSGGASFSVIGSVSDSEFTIGSHFGFLVNHTSTRNQDFFFDDVSVSFTDMTAPEIIALTVISENELDVQFSENLDPNSAEVSGNYSVDNGIGLPAMAKLDITDPSVVHLTFDQLFTNATGYELTVNDLEDLNGNSVENITESFFYILEEPAERKDIIINEILADPEPQNDLPNSEFIEVFNRSDKIFDLENWVFSDQHASAILPKTLLFPGEYLILCPLDQEAELEAFGKTIGLSGWPTLNNGGDELSIKDKDGNIVDSVVYDNSWYNSSVKQDGGWSLELIDPENECGEEENWTAAEISTGGSPGRQNSVYSQNPDLTGPRLWQALALKEDSLILRFNEKLDIKSIETAGYVIEPELNIISTSATGNMKEVVLETASIEAGQEYTVFVNNLKDCSGNLIEKAFNSFQFRLIERPDSLDVIINEILFNPRSNGVDFVEIYNRSDKYINLNQWQVANGTFKGASLTIDNEDELTKSDILLAPGEYLALTEDRLVLLEQYPLANEDRIMQVTDLPTFANEEGLVAIKTAEGNVMDFFNYLENYHSPLLDNPDGVSLERVSPEENTNLPDNWKSATATVGYATPGYENSQSRDNLSTVEGEIIIDPKVIIPGGSGQSDFAAINYRFSSPGNVATVRVFDVQGRMVKEIANNVFLSSEGFFTWDGTDESGRKARTGYYIILFELFDSMGNTKTIKGKVAVGHRF